MKLITAAELCVEVLHGICMHNVIVQLIPLDLRLYEKRVLKNWSFAGTDHEAPRIVVRARS